MSALCQKRTWQNRSVKQKDRLAAVSPKSDQVFLSGGCEGRHRYADTADGRCVVKK